MVGFTHLNGEIVSELKNYICIIEFAWMLNQEHSLRIEVEGLKIFLSIYAKTSTLARTGQCRISCWMIVSNSYIF